MNFTLLGTTATGAVQQTPDQSNIGSQSGMSEVKATQEKIKFALVDSGMGGGMAAAQLNGEVRQLGSYFCLPIGEKSPKIAAAYTAAMALWPLISPLANSKGENDERVAENVVIACNSASVRKEDAIAAMAEFCKEVASDPNKFAALGDKILGNIIKLAEEIEKKPEHLSGKVHEIVSKTAEVGVEKAIEKLKEKESVYVRIDSTAGTVQSNAYLDKFKDNLVSKYGDKVKSGEIIEKSYHDDKGDLVAKIKIQKFTIDIGNGVLKSIIVENRGNPKWVPGIEGNASKEDLDKLAKKSSEFSRSALNDSKFFESTDRSPDLNMLCCTHYPAMKDSISKIDGKDTDFLDQSQIVRTIVHGMDGYNDNPDAPLQLALTIGSQNEGGTPADLKMSIKDGEKTANTLNAVIDTTRKGSGLNSLSGKVEVAVHHQGYTDRNTDPYNIYGEESVEAGSLEEKFQCIHQYIGLVMGQEILVEQSLQRKDGELSLIEGGKLIQPTLSFGKDGIGKAYVDLNTDVQLSKNFDSLGKLTTMGEARGVDKLALYNDQGAQLRASVAQIAAVIEGNKGKNLEAQERVGILTGFSVIENKSLARVGGENDGPPGAVIMARTLLLQGLPVTLVTDHSNEASLVAALIGSGLAKINEEFEGITDNRRTLAHIVIAEQIDGKKIEVGQLAFQVPTPRPEDKKQLEEHGTLPLIAGEGREAFKAYYAKQIDATAQNLKNSNVTTMISIERPSVTQADGGSYSMLGLDVSSFNLDMSPLLGRKDSDFKPFTIGIGDGGNELGTGGVQKYTASARDERLQPFVKRGSSIAAKEDLATDVMLLSSVSNNGGITLSMALDVGLKSLNVGSDYASKTASNTLLDNTIDAYNATVTKMFTGGMSIDGVNKVNALTVDGRRMGTVEEAQQRHAEAQEKGATVPLGVGPTGVHGEQRDSSHNDMMLQFKNTLLRPL